MRVRILGGGRIVSGLGLVHAGDVLDVADELGTGLCATGLAVAVGDKPKTAVSDKPRGDKE